MKTIGLLALTALVFVGTLAAALAVTGNLSREGFERILSGPPPAEIAAPAVDEISPVLRALREREEALAQREAEAARQEEMLRIQQRDLDQMRIELADTLAKLKESLDAADEQRDERLAEVAKSFAAMRARNAAEALQGWPTEDAADVLRRVREKERGRILDEMDPAKASMILRSIQESAY